MRVCAGIYKHRILKITNLESTRETQDKVKQAIFNMIGPYFYNVSAIDLFSGCGSLGIEALSRGFDYVLFNDLNKTAYSIIKENISSLKVDKEKYDLYNLDYNKCLLSTNKTFDYVFLDPPYTLNNTADILVDILNANILNDKAQIIFEMAKETLISENNSFKIIKERIYGIKKVVILEYNK